jgi:uncharacterized repeat protein (TIGR01451 family)
MGEALLSRAKPDSREESTMQQYPFRFPHLLLGALLVLSVLSSPAGADATLVATPISWNVIGLDSNNVNVGPNNFPVGVRVCNTGTDPATNVSASFVWDDGADLYSGHPYINLRAGSLSSISMPSIAPGSCADFYFEVSITRNSNAYDKTRRYHINVTADGGISLATPQPREAYVEHLVSQNRNATTDIKLEGVSIPPGGTMALVVGQTYNITLVGFTATQGYEQIETFINFPNTIFRINSVTTTYSANDTVSPDPWAASKLYADGCTWENDPNSPNYRSCLDSGKYGGGVTVTYNVTIIAGGGTNQTLSSLIYDFSGSSYHYNSDYSASARIAAIVDPTTLTISKNFSPDPTNAGGTSRLTFTITNPNGGTIGNVSFSDTLPNSPGAMLIANPANVSTAGCGTPTVTAVAGTDTITASNITVGPNSTCAIGVDVVVPVDGTYTNTSGHLFVGSTDTGSFATDTLTVNTEPPPPPPPTSCTSPVNLAQWNYENYPASTSPNNGPFDASSQAAGVTAQAQYGPGGTGGSASGIANTTTYPTGWSAPSSTGNDGNSWGIRGGWPASGTPTGSTVPYFQFTVQNASDYGGIGFVASYNLQGNWSNSGNWYVLYSTDGASWSQAGTAVWDKSNAWQTNAITASTTVTGASTVYFRLIFVGAQYSGNPPSTTAIAYVDNVRISGCTRPDPPTLAKSFSPNPIAVGGVSTLTFTLTNSSGTTLTGSSFTDNLPAGVQVANSPNLANTCGGTVSGATAGSTSLSLSGGTIPANGSCTVSVDVTATSSGPHPNISGFISTNETGVNDGPGGSASATLTALSPPLIDKVFSPDLIAAGGVSTLTFTIINPNQDNSLTGVAFSDTFPSGVVVANPPNAATSGCGSPSFAPVAGAGSVSFSGGTIAAGGPCTVQVDVTAAAAGTYNNVSGAVTAAIAGGSDTASATLTVRTPNPGLGFAKQIATASGGPWQNFVAVGTGGNVYYRFVVENTGDVPLINVSVSDPDINLSACSWQDGDGNPLTAPFTLPVADADEGHVAYCVLGPFTAVSGSHTNTATADSDQTAPVSDSATYATTGLTLVKSSLESSFTNAGDLIHYQYVVSNSGFAPLQGPVTVTDDKASVTCPDLTTVGDNDNFLDPGESITCTATYTVTAGDVAAGYVTNNAYATVQGVDSNTDTLTIYSSTAVLADLAITKDDNSATYTPGDTLTYTITVTNNGPSNVTGASVSDAIPAQITSWTWTCTAQSGGASGCDGYGPGNANFSDTVDLPEGSSITYTVSANITSSATGNLANTATVDPPSGVTDPDTSNNTATDTDSQNPEADLAITKTDGQTTYTPGGTLTYTISVTNNGPSNVTGATVTDTFPPAITSASWTCVGSVPSATCTASGSGNINDTVTIPAGEYVTYTVTAQVSAGASGNLANTSSVAPPTGVTDPNSDNNTATDTDSQNPEADLAITKTDGQTTYTPGGTLTYTISVTNNGPSDVTGASVTDTFPAAITSASWTCVGSVPSATCTASGSGNINDTVTIPAGEYVTYTVTAQVSAGASGNLANTSSVAPPTGVTDPNSDNNTATDTDSQNPEADLAITKTDGQTTYTPGGTLTYTISVTNNGPSDVTGASVTDTFPAAITSASWTCVGSVPSATCTASGSGNINDTVTIPAGEYVTYTVTAQVSAGASGNLANTSSVTPPTGVTDPNSDNNTASDTDSQNPEADLAITKTDGTTTYTPGGTLTYTITVTNNGPSDVTGASVTDTFPAAITSASWTCVGSVPSATCTASGSGNINDTVTIPAGEYVTYTVTAQVSAGASGNLANTSSVAPPTGVTDPNSDNNTATDTDSQNPEADLAITKTDGQTTYTPGGTLTYTISVTNNGPSDVTGASVTDTFPAAITSASWTCVGSVPSATCTASGSGNINDTVTIPAGEYVTYTVTAQVSAGASGNLANTSSVTPPTGVTDPNSDNNTATDTDSQNPEADLAITKTDGQTTYTPGGTLTYTITVTNNGPSDVTGASVSDAIPAQITSWTWTCTAQSGGASGCDGYGPGNANFSDTVNLPAGASITYTVTAQVSSTAAGSLRNSASVTPPAGIRDPVDNNNAASDEDQSPTEPIPALSRTGLILLVLLVGVVAALLVGRRLG